MKVFAMASLLNLSVDCSTLKLHELDEGEKWKKEVCEKLVVDYENVVLTPISSSYKKVAGDGLRGIVLSTPLAGRLKIRRVINDGNNGFQEILTNYSFNAYKTVWVLKKKIRHGDLIDKKDIFRKKINVAPFIGLRNFDVKNPVGMTTIKNMPSGSFLYEEIISAPALIRVKDRVTVVLHLDNLKIKTIGVALENGINLEDEIKVKIIDTGAVVNAKIIGKKDVYVEI